jgi:putative ABC transport system ATP-binding protein
MPLLGSGLSARQRRERSQWLLDVVGLGARLNHLPHALSGGERQRVAIARGIVHRPSLLLADEPTGCLDSGSSDTVIELLMQIQRSQGMSLVIVTHDEALAARGQRRITLSDGRIVNDSGAGACPASNGSKP